MLQPNIKTRSVVQSENRIWPSMGEHVRESRAAIYFSHDRSCFFRSAQPEFDNSSQNFISHKSILSGSASLSILFTSYIIISVIPS